MSPGTGSSGLGSGPDDLSHDDLFALIPLAIELVHSQGELKAVTALRAKGYEPELVRSAVEQVTLRDGLDQHWPTNWLLTRDGVEQASHPLVAQFHAQVVAESGVTSIVDLTAGIGSDCAALAERGINVTAIERDPRTIVVLAHNMSRYSQATIIDGDSDVVAPASSAYFVDPARRSGTRTATGARALPERDPERWSPPLSSVIARSHSATIFMKAAPAFEPPPGWARYCISLDRNLVEMFTTNAHSGTCAVVIDSKASTTSILTETNFSPRDRDQQLDKYLFELDPAVTRAHLGSQLCSQMAHNLNLFEIGTKGMWLTGSTALFGPYWRCFMVHDTFPVKDIAHKVAHLPGVAIKNKDSLLDFNTLRKAAKKPDHNAWAVVITSVNGQEVGVLVSRVTTTELGQ